MNPPNRVHGKFRDVVEVGLHGFIDGMAAVGGVFASFEGGESWAVWLCVGAAAAAGFYELPLPYATFLSKHPKLLFFWKPRGNAAAALTFFVAASVGVGKLWGARKKNDAYVYALFTLIPPLMVAYSWWRRGSRRGKKRTAGYARPSGTTAESETLLDPKPATQSNFSVRFGIDSGFI